MGDAGTGAIATRACEWLGQYIKNVQERKERPPWRGPAEVVVYARKVVIAFGGDGPFELLAAASERYRLRIAPAESPPMSLHAEPDPGNARVLPVAYVPASLRYLIEGKGAR
jgi:hypothetical protein